MAESLNASRSSQLEEMKVRGKLEHNAACAAVLHVKCTLCYIDMLCAMMRDHIGFCVLSRLWIDAHVCLPWLEPKAAVCGMLQYDNSDHGRSIGRGCERTRTIGASWYEHCRMHTLCWSALTPSCNAPFVAGCRPRSAHCRHRWQTPSVVCLRASSFAASCTTPSK